MLANERTTDAIFDAMKEHRAYATSGDRIILDVSVNGAGMGERTAFAETRAISGRVVGTAPIDTVTVVKNGEALWQKDFSTQAEAPADGDYQLSFETSSLPLQPRDNPRGWRHWIGKLTVEGATVAQARPSDFHAIGGTAFEHMAPGTYRFRTQTRGETSSIHLRLSDVTPAAQFTIELEEALETGGAPLLWSERNVTPPAEVTLALADMDNGRVSQALPIDPWEDRVTLRRIVAKGPLDVTFALEDTGTLHGDHYYVRVTQLNDAMAWSSPIWVGGYGKR